MKITEVHVKNYRNLTDVTVKLHPESSYIIGENNLGKSNFLNLLVTICDGKSFSEGDFNDSTLPIDVELFLHLNDAEKGFFGDNFSPEDSSSLRIRISQQVQDAYVTAICVDTGESIPLKQLKKIHFLKYNTTMNPSKELRLDGKGGAGLLLSNIIGRYVETETSSSFLNEEQMAQLTTFINRNLGKVRTFNGHAIQVSVSDTPEELLSRIFYLSTDNRKIEQAGSGVQYLTMASINILCQIMEIFKGKAIPFGEHLYSTTQGEKYLPLILSIDEPEVHLHPFLQRSLLHYYKRILKNEDEDFKSLLQMLFGVDGIDGQLIVVTHSTDSMVDDYRHLIRFYKTENITKVVSGSSLELKKEHEKQLLMHFPDLKESFFAHCVILVEGETEYGCMESFATTLGISLDDLSISVVNARGQNSIKPIQKLLKEFGIISIAIYDNDVKQGQVPTDMEFFTKELCFEIEIVKHLYALSCAHTVRKIVHEMGDKEETTILDWNFVKSGYKKLGIDKNSYVPKALIDVADDEEDEFCNMFSAWCINKKGVILGRTIGFILNEEMIPDSYKNALNKAKEVAENV